MGDKPGGDVTITDAGSLSQQLQQVAFSNNNAKLPMLRKDEYEIWAMKMQNWISSVDFNLWNVILTGSREKKTTVDAEGNITIAEPVTAEDIMRVQRENKARTILLQAIPDSHMSDFHNMTDPKQIWNAIKVRFGGNEDSKRIRKSRLKQEFQEFKITEEEGIHKGYDRFHTILSQLNQILARPDNEEVNSKFLRALPPSWSPVTISFKTKGGLDYLSFDDLFNKLKAFEGDVKGNPPYTAPPTQSAFVSSTSNYMPHTYSGPITIPNQGPPVTTLTFSHANPITHPKKSNVIEDVLHSFVAEVDKQQQLAYEDFEQIDELNLEELDLKWQMAMLSLKVRRFEQKAGRKLDVNGRDAARFDRKKVKCYSCGKAGHFSRECPTKKGEANTRYSAYKKREVEASESKALITAVDAGTDWNEHEDATSNSQVSCIASCDFGLMGISPQVTTCVCDHDSKYATLKQAYDEMKPKYNASFIEAATYKEALKTLEQQKMWFQQNQLAYDEKIRVLSSNLENTSNELKFSLKEKARIESEKDVLKEKLDKEVARHKEWLMSGDKLASCLYGSQAVNSGIGLCFKKYVGLEARNDMGKSTPAGLANYVKEGDMHSVSGPIRGVFMPTNIKTSDFDGSHHLFGKKSTDLPNLTCKPSNSDSSTSLSTPKLTKLDLPEKEEHTGIRIKTSPSTNSSNDSNTYVSCSNRDKASETSSQASCDSNTKSVTPKSSNKSSYKSVDTEDSADEVYSKMQFN
jgi:hypothetical protein